MSRQSAHSTNRQCAANRAFTSKADVVPVRPFTRSVQIAFSRFAAGERVRLQGRARQINADTLNAFHRGNHSTVCLLHSLYQDISDIMDRCPITNASSSEASNVCCS